MYPVTGSIRMLLTENFGRFSGAHGVAAGWTMTNSIEFADRLQNNISSED